MSVISEDDTKIFCSNCNRTIKEQARTNLKTSVPHCFHVETDKGYLVTVEAYQDGAEQIAEHFTKVTGRKYTVRRCDKK
jgi:hypothetical protein